MVEKKTKGFLVHQPSDLMIFNRYAKQPMMQKDKSVKNVKKPSGSKPGMVTYTNNKTINVNPKTDG